MAAWILSTRHRGATLIEDFNLLAGGVAGGSILVLGVAGDAVLGDRHRYGFVPHPVVIMGGLVSWLDHKVNPARRRYNLQGDFNFVSEEERSLEKDHESKQHEFMMGLLSLIILVLLSVCLGVLIEIALSEITLIIAIVCESLIIAILLSSRCLYDHVQAVAKACRGDSLALMQESLQHIVSRDTKLLDKWGVARGAFDSLCDNYVDGVVAPLFWWAIFGIPGIIVYKMVNVADSMTGYHAQPYLYYGKVAARTDDFLNLIPARLAAFNLLIASLFMGLTSFWGAFYLLKRGDMHAHRSPSAGWPEAVFAGAINIKIGGERTYPGNIKVEQWIGCGTEQVDADHIERGLSLYKFACFVNVVNVLIVFYLTEQISNSVFIWLRSI